MIALMLMLWLGLLVGPLDAAQQVGKVPRIGRLAFGRADSQRAQSLREVFLQGLREVGWVKGQNIIIEERWAEEQAERLPDLAAELVRLPVDVIVAGGEPAIRALKQATSALSNCDFRVIIRRTSYFT